MGDIELRISDRLLERIAFIIIIIVLGVLLVMSYLHNSCDTTQEKTTQVAQNKTTQEVPATNETANETAAVKDPTPPEETCTDNKKNQDETDVDCGGTICHTCDDGKNCRSSDDCESGNCKEGTCVSLSGKVELKNLKVTSLISKFDTAKVTGIKGTIFNGLDKDVTIDLEIYAMTSDKNYYLETLDDDESINGPSKPYGSAFIGKIKSGASTNIDFDSTMLGTTYLFGRPENYNPGDDFAIEVLLIDHNTGDELVKQTIVKRV